MNSEEKNKVLFQRFMQMVHDLESVEGELLDINNESVDIIRTRELRDFQEGIRVFGETNSDYFFPYEENKLASDFTDANGKVLMEYLFDHKSLLHQMVIFSPTGDQKNQEFCWASYEPIEENGNIFQLVQLEESVFKTKYSKRYFELPPDEILRIMFYKKKLYGFSY